MLYASKIRLFFMKKYDKKSKKQILSVGKFLTGFFIFIIGLGALFLPIAWASNLTTLSQSITAGTLSVDIVDASGVTVGSPAVSFNSMTFNFDKATTTGTFGTSSQKIRLSNPTATAAWSVTLAATSGATTTWTDGGSNTFDFNDPAYADDGGDADSVGGRLAVDPSVASLAGVSGCSTSNVSLGSSSAFNEGVTNSVTVYSSTTAATYCRWDLTGVALSQSIPAGQKGATYSLNLTLTAS